MSPDAQLATAGPGTSVEPADDPALDLHGTVDPHGATDAATDAAADLHAAWSGVLDDLAAMSAGAGPAAGAEVMDRLVTWTPPTDLGRLPASLVDRALEVLAGHAHIVDHLHEAVAENRRHARALSSVPTVHDAPAAAYLDVEA
ncbi:hypothetical protein EQW78_13110 [Oerskovia turbata]|uniref:Uncharacterized protein n=1 Tax=Oerskovia turbata TaxID=1713 RepID=A0A4Q1KS60_9CELL|nr:hypothetical protein [Oerskovia turbata]RXR23651.1 hypothetical protein EQW73_15130 [Oerskovia turbata]RXR32921.1 hypothetical protein EQW78_13110 [Oerskovia turbata]